MNYKDWLAYKSNLAKRDVSLDEENYDLEGYFNSINQTSVDPDYKPDGNPYNGHLPDTFKKPNHPTFSDQSKYHVPVVKQGGNWSEEGKFTPSEHNLQNMKKDHLQSYFNEVESPEALDLPQSARFSALRKISGR
jgi:hypothetical protein